MELNELKKLDARERLRKLKELEKEKKKEIEEAEELIRASEREIDNEEDFRRKVPIEEVRAESISQLEGVASQEAKRIWRTSRELGETQIETTGTAGETSLEATVETSRTRAAEEQGPEYGRAIERAKREQEEVLYQKQKAEEGESPAEKYSRMERPGEMEGTEERTTGSYKRRK